MGVGGATGQVRPGVSFAQAGAPPRGAGGEAGGGSLLGAPDVAPEPRGPRLPARRGWNCRAVPCVSDEAYSCGMQRFSLKIEQEQASYRKLE